VRAVAEAHHAAPTAGARPEPSNGNAARGITPIRPNAPNGLAETLTALVELPGLVAALQAKVADLEARLTNRAEDDQLLGTWRRLSWSR